MPTSCSGDEPATVEGERQVAVVTGANRGIGREVARRLAERGYRTLLGSRRLEHGEAAARDLAAEGIEVTPQQLDVTDPASVDRLAARIEDEWGRVDVLVNNAGAVYDTWQRPLGADLDLAMRALEVNMLGPWRMCIALAPMMTAGARVVNVSSGSGSLAGMGEEAPAYGVSKAALNALTRKLAAELRGSGVLVNAVCPGWVRTEMTGGAGDRSVEEGADSVLWAVDLPDDRPTGGFFRDGRPLPW